MRKLLPILALAASLQAAPVVSGISVDGLGDSSVRVIFNTSATFNWMQLRYGPADCASGTGQYIQISGTSSATYRLYGMTQDLSGLAHATTYYVCPEVSDDGGSTHSSGVSYQFTTLAQGTTTPTAPTAVSTTFPTQTGSTLTVSGTCAHATTGLQAKLTGASKAVPSDTIVVPKTMVCPDTIVLPDAPNLKDFDGGIDSTEVRISDSRITIPSHGLSSVTDTEVSLSSTGCLPGMSIFLNLTSCDYGGSAWRKGIHYFAHYVDANNIQLLDAAGGSPVVPGWIPFTCSAGGDTITFLPGWYSPDGYEHTASDGTIAANTSTYIHSSGTPCGGLAMDVKYFMLSACTASGNAGCTTQLSLTSGGAAIDITSAGTGTHKLADKGTGTHYLAAIALPTDPWILITTDGVLPVGQRVSSALDAQMFEIQRPTASTGSVTPAFRTGILTRNIRIVGAKWSALGNDDYLTETDPRGQGYFISTGQDSENIVFDRTRLQGMAYPWRSGSGSGIVTKLDGKNIAVIHSDWVDMNWFRPSCSGFTESNNTTSATFAAGECSAGSSIVQAVTTTATVITVTAGSTSGTIKVYFARSDGHMKVLPPTGLTVTCTGHTGVTCDVLSAVASPAFPLSANFISTSMQLANITVAAGVVTGTCISVTGCILPNTNIISEGATCIIAGIGPGPYLLDDDHIEGTGVCVHFDDSGGPLYDSADYTVTNNWFETKLQYMFGHALNTTHMKWGHRQPLEWKKGQRIKVDGNKFSSFAENNGRGSMVAMTPRSGGYITDFEYSNNVSTGAACINIPQPIDAYHPISKPVQRIKISNNLCMLNAVTTTVSPQSVRGWCFDGGYGGENYLIEHNTCFDPRGNTPSFIYWAQHPSNGMIIRNNVMFFTGNQALFKGENVSPVATCGAAADKALLDCAFTNGPGVPSYTFVGNVIVPWYSNTVSPGAIVSDATVNTAMGTLLSGGTNYLPAGVGIAAKLATVKFQSSHALGTMTGLDLGLAYGSPYHLLGTDGLNIGYNPPSPGTTSNTKFSNSKLSNPRLN